MKHGYSALENKVSNAAFRLKVANEANNASKLTRRAIVTGSPRIAAAAARANSKLNHLLNNFNRYGMNNKPLRPKFTIRRNRSNKLIPVSIPRISGPPKKN
jgi:hypothetical protein